MRWMCLLALTLIATSAWAEHSSALNIADEDAKQIRTQLSYWHDTKGQASADLLFAQQFDSQFQLLQPEHIFPLKPGQPVWLKLEIDRLDTSTVSEWAVWLPLSLIDTVTIYQPADRNPGWVAQKAGDRVAVNQWPEPGRYPRFHLDVPFGKSLIYLKIESSTPLSLPLYLGTDIHAQSTERAGMLGLGAIFGVMLSLVLVCMVTAVTYRDKLYAMYGIYTCLMILAIGAYTGLSAYLLWPFATDWADTSQGVLAFVAVGGAAFFIEALLGGRLFALVNSRLLHGLAFLALPMAIFYYWAPRNIGVPLLVAFMLGTTTFGLGLAARAWIRGDQVGKWVVLAYSPLCVAVLLSLVRALGLIGSNWLVQYSVVVALLIEVPMMVAALNTRSRQRHEMQTRELAMATQDALTGLLTEHIFDDRLQQTLTRYNRKRENAAVIVISLVNYSSIVSAYGARIGEQSILRSVIKLRKVLRDADTLARLGNSHFGLIIEGVGHRSSVTTIGARLIAQGLMPLQGVEPEVTLQFHVAAALLRDCDEPPTIEIKNNLHALLGSMSRRTRRPIRFLETDYAAKAQALSEQKTQGTQVVTVDGAEYPVQSKYPVQAAESMHRDARLEAMAKLALAQQQMGEFSPINHGGWSGVAQPSDSSLPDSVPASDLASDYSTDHNSEAPTQVMDMLASVSPQPLDTPGISTSSELPQVNEPVKTQASL